ncbi:NACAD protein, partial [Urocolius indicus]|nr:NACAD protein [Urocolius indicus]
PPADPLDTRIVMGEETRPPPAPELRDTPSPSPPPPPVVPCPFPAPAKEPPTGRPPAAPLDPDLFFTAPSTPIRVGGSRLPPAPHEEQTDGDSEGLCSPPTSPSGSYMTAEGGSWGSSGTASTSPSCSPNLVAEAEGSVEAEVLAALPSCLTLSPEEDEDDDDDDEPFVPPGDDDDDDDDEGQTPEEEEDEEWGMLGPEGLPGAGLIPAALLPFRGSLLFQAEAVEITPLPPGTAPLPLSRHDGEEEEDEGEEEEEEEEEGGSTSASFLRSLSESSIPEGVDESFAFHDDTSASSDSAAYDGEEDERLYGTERHALPPGTAGPGVLLQLQGAPAGTPQPPGTGDTRLQQRDGSGTPPAPCGECGVELDGDTFLTSSSSSSSELEPDVPWEPDPVPGGDSLPQPHQELALPGAEEEPESRAASSPELPAANVQQQPLGLCSRDPQTHGLLEAPANGEPQDSPRSDGDDRGDGDRELGTGRSGSTEPAATPGHHEPATVATNATPSPPGSAAAEPLM